MSGQGGLSDIVRYVGGAGDVRRIAQKVINRVSPKIVTFSNVPASSRKPHKQL
jgi:hypothetical protein